MEPLNYHGYHAGGIRIWGDAATGRVEVPPARASGVSRLLFWSGVGMFLFAAPASWLDDRLPVPMSGVSFSIALAAIGILLMAASPVRHMIWGQRAAVLFEWKPLRGGAANLRVVTGPLGEFGAERHEWPATEIADIAIGYSGRRLGTMSRLALEVRPISGPTIRLLSDRAPVDLLKITDVLRQAVGLPSRREARAAWLVRKAGTVLSAAPREHGPAMRVLPATEPAPVLPYAGAPRRVVGAMTFEPGRLIAEMSCESRAHQPARPVTLTLDADELVLDAPEVSRRWQCDQICGVFGGRVEPLSPPVLVVGAVDGIAWLNLRCDKRELEQAADLVNEALNIVNGSQRSNEPGFFRRRWVTEEE